MTGRNALDSREIAVAAARAAAEKKAEDVLALDVAELLVVTDCFVICSGRNDRQVKTIAEEVEDRLREDLGVKPIGREGVREARWILLDFGDVVVHIFQPSERDFYRLEKLWSDAPRLAFPEDVTGPTGVAAAAADGAGTVSGGAERVAEEAGE